MSLRNIEASYKINNKTHLHPFALNEEEAAKFAVEKSNEPGVTIVFLTEFKTDNIVGTYYKGEKIGLLPTEADCEKCGRPTRFTVTVVDREAPWCGCS